MNLRKDHYRTSHFVENLANHFSGAKFLALCAEDLSVHGGNGGKTQSFGSETLVAGPGLGCSTPLTGVSVLKCRRRF